MYHPLAHYYILLLLLYSHCTIYRYVIVMKKNWCFYLVLSKYFKLLWYFLSKINHDQGLNAYKKVLYSKQILIIRRINDLSEYFRIFHLDLEGKTPNSNHLFVLEKQAWWHRSELSSGCRYRKPDRHADRKKITSENEFSSRFWHF